MTAGLESLPLSTISPDGSGKWVLKWPLSSILLAAFLNLLNQPSQPRRGERTPSPQQRFNLPFQSKAVRQGRCRHDSNTMHGHTRTGSAGCAKWGWGGGVALRMLEHAHVRHTPGHGSILAIIQVTMAAGFIVP